MTNVTARLQMKITKTDELKELIVNLDEMTKLSFQQLYSKQSIIQRTR